MGKTSLVRRYVQNEFDDQYATTLGARTMKKEVQIRSNPRVRLAW